MSTLHQLWNYRNFSNTSYTLKYNNTYLQVNSRTIAEENWKMEHKAANEEYIKFVHKSLNSV